MMEALRVINLVVWIILVILLRKPMLKATWQGGASPMDKVLAAVWWLSLNRICFVMVSQYTPDEDAARAFCYAFATAGGIAMLVAVRGALRVR